MGTVTIFPLVLRAPPGPLQTDRLATVVPFPLIRQPGYVDRIARHIRSMPLQDQRNRYLVSIIHIEFNRQLDAGVDQLLVEADLKAFADAVWMAVRGEQRGGAA